MRPLVDPLVQVPQDTRGHAPDIALAERHGVVLALDALPVAAVQRVVVWHPSGRRAAPRTRRRPRARIEREPIVRADARHRRQDAKARERQIEVEIADRLDQLARRARSPPRLRAAPPPRGVASRRIDLAARETRSGRDGSAARCARSAAPSGSGRSTTGISTAAGRVALTPARLPQRRIEIEVAARRRRRRDRRARPARRASAARARAREEIRRWHHASPPGSTGSIRANSFKLSAGAMAKNSPPRRRRTCARRRHRAPRPARPDRRTARASPWPTDRAAHAGRA